jgi:hypothetical protein
MGFYINVCPSLIMRLIEYKNRIKDKIKVGVDLDKNGKMDIDLQFLIENLDDLEITWQEQMGLIE